MKLRKKTPVLLVLVLCIALALFYRRSLPLPKIFPGLDLSQCASITLQGDYYKESPRESVTYHQTFTPENKEFEQILSLLKQAEFRRSLWGLIPSQGTRTHPLQTGDIRWEIHCIFPDGGLWVQNFFGDFTLSFQETSSLPVTPVSSQWVDSVTAIMTK
ncbi:hypothetical protein [Intestinimonas butyriciproducens]|uniref:hypothetical protein n=1 Tax=Intestinimonas butyriciproducens TaxID=1297617 RepID=UPI0019565671|nr:hypothetical protein [Intestinimonas butyriciproducens]MBM6918803.1 hypothetical protein [Intestinimonas butyriciproducens]